FISWINVEGVHDTALIQQIGEEFGLHPLVLEDIVNTRERPKIEDYQDYLYFVLNMATLDENRKIRTEQVSIVLGKDFILSFQEVPDDIFDPIRHRIDNPHAKLRKMGPDYLAYLLLDAVVDGYFFLIEHFGEKIDALEEELMDNPKKATLHKIYALKREVVSLRKSVWPMREVVHNIQRSENDLLSEELSIFLRDFYDHIMRIIDSIETFRDTISGMVDLYLSNSSIKMNEVMQVLTLISTIFIPLTFITGLYGMNFDFIPELHWGFGYPVVLGIMVVMVVAQLIYFRRKKWL
ncbi:MAG: magnesium/cobalt transporter CorA, partial [Bacteroidota bacterium]